MPTETPKARGRDYYAEMRALIDEATSHGPYVPGRVAEEIVEKLRANDQELLNGWLHAGAENFLRLAINDRDRSWRAVHARRAGAHAFRAAAESHDTGDSTELRGFLNAPYTVADGSRRPLADLSRDDLLYVAETYRQRASENSMRAAFMDALAKKVKEGVVSDYFTEDQLSAMFESLSA